MKRPLSEAETQLAARYHNLIYRVMNDTHIRGDAASDLYGEAALALILAAQRYLTDESLQEYRFTTIAYNRIRQALLREWRKLAKQPHTVSLDALLEDGGTLYDMIPNNDAADPAVTVANPAADTYPALRLARSRKRYAAAPLPEREAA